MRYCITHFSLCYVGFDCPVLHCIALHIVDQNCFGSPHSSFAPKPLPISCDPLQRNPFNTEDDEDEEDEGNTENVTNNVESRFAYIVQSMKLNNMETGDCYPVVPCPIR